MDWPLLLAATHLLVALLGLALLARITAVIALKQNLHLVLHQRFGPDWQHRRPPPRMK